MEKIHFEIRIHASKEKVWDILWKDETYPQWTSAFTPGSYAVSDWKEGSRVHFLSPAGEGIFSEIVKMIPGEFMSFRHLGLIKDRKEQPVDEETKKWTGGTENYTLTEENGFTHLEVSVDVNEQFRDYLEKSFPKALEIVRVLSEK